MLGRQVVTKLENIHVANVGREKKLENGKKMEVKEGTAWQLVTQSQVN
jgi:hypothetical protein